MVYSNTVAIIKEITGEIGYSVYYHHAEGKGELLAEFIAGEEEVIVATSALGMGINILDIREIIYVYTLRTLLKYV